MRRALLFQTEEEDMSEFKNVTVARKANIYFDGKVTFYVPIRIVTNDDRKCFFLAGSYDII